MYAVVMALGSAALSAPAQARRVTAPLDELARMLQ